MNAPTKNANGQNVDVNGNPLPQKLKTTYIENMLAEIQAIKDERNLSRKLDQVVMVTPKVTNAIGVIVTTPSKVMPPPNVTVFELEEQLCNALNTTLKTRSKVNSVLDKQIDDISTEIKGKTKPIVLSSGSWNGKWDAKTGQHILSEEFVSESLQYMLDMKLVSPIRGNGKPSVNEKKFSYKVSYVFYKSEYRQACKDLGIAQENAISESMDSFFAPKVKTPRTRKTAKK